MKVYVDQYRVLVVPDMHAVPISLLLGGIASQDARWSLPMFVLQMVAA